MKQRLVAERLAIGGHGNRRLFGYQELVVGPAHGIPLTRLVSVECEAHCTGEGGMVAIQLRARDPFFFRVSIPRTNSGWLEIRSAGS